LTSVARDERDVRRQVFEYERTVDGDAVKADVRPPPA
jgi:hypothetical protein